MKSRLVIPCIGFSLFCSLLVQRTASEIEKGLLQHVVGVPYRKCRQQCDNIPECRYIRYLRLVHVCKMYYDENFETETEHAVTKYLKDDVDVDECMVENKCHCSKDASSASKCVACGQPPMVNGATVRGNMPAVGSHIQYVCTIGPIVEGAPDKARSTCLANGTWTHVDLQCTLCGTSFMNPALPTDMSLSKTAHENDTHLALHVECKFGLKLFKSCTPLCEKSTSKLDMGVCFCHGTTGTITCKETRYVAMIYSLPPGSVPNLTEAFRSWNDTSYPVSDSAGQLRIPSAIDNLETVISPGKLLMLAFVKDGTRLYLYFKRISGRPFSKQSWFNKTLLSCGELRLDTNGLMLHLNEDKFFYIGYDATRVIISCEVNGNAVAIKYFNDKNTIIYPATPPLTETNFAYADALEVWMELPD